MPELPEVETTRRGIAPHLEGQTFRNVVVRQKKLRWDVPEIGDILPGLHIGRVRRRAKYLLIECVQGERQVGTLIMHLGMSGSLRVLPADTPPQKHDHIDLHFGKQCPMTSMPTTCSTKRKHASRRSSNS